MGPYPVWAVEDLLKRSLRNVMSTLLIVLSIALCLTLILRG